MDFEQLRIFLVLAEQGTFLGAASKLETSRSRVRRKLDQLEKAAGTPLVTREKTGLKLTPAGRVLERRGRALLRDADHLISHVHEIGTTPTGRLKVALPTGPPPRGWQAIRERLQARFPDLEIEIFFSEHPTELLPDCAELAITFETTIPESLHGGQLGEFPMHFFVSDAYLARHNAPKSVEDLEENPDGHRIALWRPALAAGEPLHLRDGRILTLKPHFVSDEAGLLFEMAHRGDCIAYLPALPELLDPSLKVLFGDQIAGTVRERLVVPNILADVPRVAAFVELTQETCGQGD